MAAGEETAGGQPAGMFFNRSRRLGAAFVVLVTIFAAAAAYDLSDGILFLGDIDDRLRAIQIRQLLGGKSWYDLTISGLSMPEPYISPWSRLIDAPYAGITWLLAHFLPFERALSAAFTIWPPVLMLAFAAFSAGCIAKLMPSGRPVRPLHVLVAALAMVYACLEFVPGRIDHHNMQLVTLAAASYGILCWSAAGGVLTAAAIALSVTIGLETMPLIAVLWAGLGLAWISARPGANAIFRSFSIAIAILAPCITLVFSGPGVLFGIQNDIFSAPYAAAFTGCGLISACMTFLIPPQTSWNRRLLALALPGTVLLVLIASSMPGVLAGPYAIIDPVSRHLWLEHVDQEHSILFRIRAGVTPVAFELALQATIAWCAGVLAIRDLRAGRAGPAIILALGTAAFLASLDAYRFIRFPAAILPLFIPRLLDHLGIMPAVRQRNAVAAATAATAVLSGLFWAIATLMPVERELATLDAADFLMLDTCSAADRKAMGLLPAGRYMVTPAVGLTFLESAAPGAAVADISYHRASPGMRRMFDALYMSDAAARKSALAPFDYLAFCSYPDQVRAQFQAPQGSLFAALLGDNPPAAFIPQPIAGSRHLKLYRIDHEGL
jgi:hypothetical protein